MVRIVYDEVVCPHCRGEGWQHGKPHPRQPRLSELVRCAPCGGAGWYRQALLARVADVPLAA